MFSGLRKIVTFVGYLLVILLGIIFAVSNREMVKLTFYPLPFELSTPLFLFTMIILMVGILVGWMITHMGIIRLRLESRQFSKKIAALENELRALHSEQLINAPTFTKK